MPKVFLVKRRSLGVSVRSWDELPDEKRADTYIPEGLGSLLHDPPEDCRSDGGSSSGSGSSSAGEPGGAESSSSPQVPERETPELGYADGPEGHLAAKQRPVARSKIKFTTGTCSDSVVHSCNLCGKGFRLQRMLNRHLKCHNQVKRHLCAFCGKGFNDTFDLKRHVRTHTDYAFRSPHSRPAEPDWDVTGALVSRLSGAPCGACVTGTNMSTAISPAGESVLPVGSPPWLELQFPASLVNSLVSNLSHSTFLNQ
ncbi:transcription factor Ovo-like 2 isoform X2 [Callithrix jacchus]|uniref:Ovo like zinc finger 2 n=1 Tax=Callithrix jacchus TaxID=9483 RepID=A0A8I3XC15_CALJA